MPVSRFHPNDLYIGGFLSESILLDFSRDWVVEVLYTLHPMGYSGAELERVRSQFKDRMYEFRMDATQQLVGDLADTIRQLRSSHGGVRLTEVQLEAPTRSYHDYRQRRQRHMHHRRRPGPVILLHTQPHGPTCPPGGGGSRVERVS